MSVELRGWKNKKFGAVFRQTKSASKGARCWKNLEKINGFDFEVFNFFGKAISQKITSVPLKISFFFEFKN